MYINYKGTKSTLIIYIRRRCGNAVTCLIYLRLTLLKLKGRTPPTPHALLQAGTSIHLYHINTIIPKKNDVGPPAISSASRPRARRTKFFLEAHPLFPKRDLKTLPDPNDLTFRIEAEPASPEGNDERGNAMPAGLLIPYVNYAMPCASFYPTSVYV